MNVRNDLSGVKVLILAKNSDFAWSILCCLRDAGIQCHLFDGSNGQLPLSKSRYCSGYRQFPFTQFLDTEVMLPKINDYCKEHGIQVVMPSNMPTGYLVSKIKDRLAPGVSAFPIAEYGTLMTLNDKWKLAALLQEHGIPIPKTERLERVDQLDTLQDWQFPVIVKPPNMGNQRGVVKIDSMAELRSYLTSGQEFTEMPLLLQEFIPGRDIGFNVLAHEGTLLAHTIHQYTHRKSVMQFIEQELALEQGRRMIAASNFTGVANIDMRIDSRDQSVKVIECNPRFWGSLRASCRNGTNFPVWGIRKSLGLKLPEPVNRKISYILPTRLVSQLKQKNWDVLEAVSWYTLWDFWQAASDTKVFLSKLKPALEARMTAVQLGQLEAA